MAKPSGVRDGKTGSAESKTSFWDMLKDKGREHIAAAIIAGVALALTTGAAIAWAAIKSWIVFDMPAGAVVAYDLRDRCPAGWSQFEAGNGRVIIGAGKGDSLAPRPFGQPGGREQHTLTLQQIPAHSHSYVDWRSGPGSCTFSGCNGTGGDQSKTTGMTGGRENGSTEAFEIMPPYLALRLCKKD